MNNVRALAEELGFPRETLPLILELPEYAEYSVRLCGKGYAAAAEELYRVLGADEGGWKMLSVQLAGALLTREHYRKRGISDEIFLDTMGCFNRFVREHKESCGTYGFDRWWWTGRQLSMELFRIGALEYELADGDIAVHIPSDADLSEGALDRSFADARIFFKEKLNESGDFVCTSWLLSPVLEQLLPSDSKILGFQRRFTLEGVEDSEEYKVWLFKNPSLLPENFPENTTLQRNAKAFILSGGKIGAGTGRIKK